MPNIIEETDEEMSNNCSPNKTELLAQLMKKQKQESIFFSLFFNEKKNFQIIKEKTKIKILNVREN